MRKLLIIFFFIPLFLGAQTTLTFTSISGSTDVPSYGRGAEVWINRRWDNTSGQGVNMPAGNSTRPPTNYYTRFLWRQEAFCNCGIEGNTLGSYTFTAFDTEIHRAMDNHQMFSFRVMPVCDQCGGTVPTYVQTLIEANANVNLRGYTSSDGTYIPNWNNSDYLVRYRAMLVALKAHIDGSTYTPSWSGSPIPLSKVIYQVDIGGYGNYGEWHQFPWVQDAGFPSRIIPTATALDSLINMNLNVFPQNQAVILIAAFGASSGTAGNQFEPPTEVGYRVLTSSNQYGQIGWRRDNWGDPQYSATLENNSRSYNPGTGNVAFAPLIMNKYKFAPVTGEPLNTLTDHYAQLSPEVNLYHAAGIGDGNLLDPANPTTQANYQAAMLSAGYRLALTGGSMTTTLTSGGAFNLQIIWSNTGLAPTYETWTVNLQLRNPSTHAVVWTGNSTFNPKLLAAGSTLTQNDNFTLGAVSNGTYGLYIGAVDPQGYKLPLSLAITGQGADGYYPVRTGITVGSGGNISPTAQINGTNAITLPTNSVSLSGSSSFDPDGTIVSYAWSVIACGTYTATIASPTAATTSVTGMDTAGVYTFQLTVTDNLGATGSDTIVVIVSPATPFVGLGIFTTQTPGGSFSVFTSQNPATPLTNDGQGVNLGVKFRSTSALSIIGVRFYKQVGNNGTHIGQLYNTSGTLLATGTFTSETASGWQTLIFTTPVAISANTTYVASYFSPNGTYSDDNNYFTTAVTNGTMSLLADGTDGGNGVYSYVGSAAYPGLSNGVKSNYYVDVVASAQGTLQNDGQPIELGVKFRSNVPISVTGIRFYKIQGNNGTHVGELYTGTGVRLASATFTSETSGGWQTVTFSSPVLISANTTYVAAYFSPLGTYVEDDNYFTNTGVTNGALTALQSGVDGVNGVYNYGIGPTFPTLTFLNGNYWVDVTVSLSTSSPAGTFIRKRRSTISVR